MNFLNVYSIFRSIQGESTYTGIPCVFVRLAGCNAGCTYCDTVEACVSEGIKMSPDEIAQKVASFNTELVEITGGEPLEQKETWFLLSMLTDRGFNVLLETNGLHSIKDIDERVTIIMDVKTFSSGLSKMYLEENLRLKREKTEYKFVVGSEEDLEFTEKIVKKYKLLSKGEVLVSPLSETFRKKTAEFILKSGLPLRLQLQQHKIIWPDADSEC